MAALVMAEYAEAFDSPTASATPTGGMRGGFASGGYRGPGSGGGFVRAGGTKAVGAVLMRRGSPCGSYISGPTSKRSCSNGLLESQSNLSTVLIDRFSHALRRQEIPLHPLRLSPSQKANERWTNSYRRSKGTSSARCRADRLQQSGGPRN